MLLVDRRVKPKMPKACPYNILLIEPHMKLSIHDMKRFRYIYFIVLALIAIFDVSAKNIIEQVIEPALVEVRYERRMVLDTLNPENDYKKNFFTLKAGKTVSAFYSAELKTMDSIDVRDREFFFIRHNNKELQRYFARLPNAKIFKNYPEGKIRVHDRFDLSQWTIDEDWEKPIWNITDSVCKIMGYQCILATTDFRGRRWEAWFAPEIPISDGPWKLCGLPGLILKARDSKSHYIYQPISIRTENAGDVEYYDYQVDFRLTMKNRKKGLQRKFKHLHTDIHYKIVSSGMFGINNPNVKKRDKKPHSNYDFEETDYVKPKLE